MEEATATSWKLWDNKKIVTHLRKLLNLSNTVDLDGTLRALTLIKELTDETLPKGFTMYGNGHTNNFAWLQGYNAIIKRYVNDEARKDCSFGGAMHNIREYLLRSMEKNTETSFGSGMVLILKPLIAGAITYEAFHRKVLLRYDSDMALWNTSQRLNVVYKKPFDDKATKHKVKRELNHGANASTTTPGGGSFTQTKKVKHPLCNGCGKPHGSLCLLKGEDQAHPTIKRHPDYNTENVPWLESKMGKAWKVKGDRYTSLPCRRTLKGDVYVCHPDIKGGVYTQCNACNDVQTTIDNSLEWNRTIMYLTHPNHPTPYRLEVLLDSGSLGAGGNYISTQVGDVLRQRGYEGKATSRTVCSCFADDCRKLSNDIFKIQLTYKTDSNADVSHTMQIECVEINTTHDMIVGYETLSHQKAFRDALVKQLMNDSPSPAPPTPSETDKAAENRSDDPHISVKGRKRSKVMRSSHDERVTLNTTDTHNVDNNVVDLLSLMRIDGDADLQSAIREVVRTHAQAFSSILNKEAAKITPMDLKFLPDTEWLTSANSQPPRQQSRVKAEEILAQVDKMLKAGIVRQSEARAYSQVMMTPKKDGSWRFCVDFRRLNVITEPNRFPLPRIDILLRRLGEKAPKYFAVLDLTKGYYQAPLSEGAKKLTAFITPNGLYEWNRVAMGLTGAPGYFQRAMATEVLSDLLYVYCELYLDDIVVFGSTPEEFLNNLKKVLARLIKHNVTINPAKCQIGLEEIEYVGHTVNSKGTHFSREKLQKVINFTRPKTGKQLRSFLGLANYFREHVVNHSTKVEPLTRLLDNYNPKAALPWTDLHQKAFEEVQVAINQCPMLFFMDYESPVHLYTDASDIGIGGYLCQVKDTKEFPVAFYSKSLTKEEKKWGTPALEGYAIFRAFQHFDYLVRDCFTNVHTDHLNLIYIKDSIEGKVIRWKLALQEYNFKLVHVRGIDNPIADIMSRNDAADLDEYVIAEPRKAVNMLNQMISHFSGEEAPCCQTCAESHVPEYMTDKDQSFAMYSNQHTIQPTCGLCNTASHMLNALDTEAKFTIPPEAYQFIMDAHNDMVGHHGVEATMHLLDKQERNWPFRREQVRRFIRDCAFCQKNTYTSHEVQIPRYVAGRYQPMERLAIDTMHLPGGEKFKEGEGNTYVVAIIDCFSRFLGLYAIATLNAETVASVILQHAGIFGIPSELISDRGTGDFLNEVVQEMLDRIGTNSFTTLAHSKEENGIVERSNKETWRWLRALLYDKRIGRTNITKALPFVTRIHNATQMKQSGYSPGQIIFGTRVELDRNVLLTETERNEPTATVTEWMSEHEQIQNTIITIAREQQERTDRKNMVHRSQTNKENADTEFAIGSFVLVSYPPTDYGDRRPNKVTCMHHGPYEVAERKGIQYTLQNLVSKKMITKSVFLLRPFRYDATRTDPTTVALTDYTNEFYVEAILAETGHWSKRTGTGKITFTVKWEDYGEDYNSEECFADLKWNTVFREYAKSKGMGKYLPKDDE